MLGETLSDPLGVEAGGTIRGMGLLPMDTVFAGEKTRTRVDGRFHDVQGVLSGLNGVELEGYEIHMGVSTRKDGTAPLTRITDTNTADGACKEDGAQLRNVYGSYVHGIFNKEQVADRIIQAIGKKKGIDTSGMTGVDYQTFKETQYDILAAELRKNLSMPKIYNILQEGI